MFNTKLNRILNYPVLAAVALLACSVAGAQETNVTVVGGDIFLTDYFDVGTSAFASRAGFGGSDGSGGAGENILRISNSTIGNGILCAMIYVFDDSAEMQTCCGCPVTPHGMRTLSVIKDLTSNFAVNKADLNAGVIEIVSSTSNFNASLPQPGPVPLGTNGACSPTGSASSDVFHRAAEINPTSGLRAWITHDESGAPTNSSGKRAVGVPVDEFEDSPLEAAHVAALEKFCAAQISNGGGTGLCTCGSGQNTIASDSTASH